MRAVAANLKIVSMAAFTVAVGTGALAFARTDFFAAFGPALSAAVVTSLLVSITLVPALIAAFGRATFWPRRHHGPRERRERTPWLLRLVAAGRGRSIAAAAIVVVLLAAASLPVLQMRMGYDAITGLPDESEPARGQHLLEQAFAPGIIAPSVVLVEGEDLHEHTRELSRLQVRIASHPGVAGVLGPGSLELLRRATPRSIGQLSELNRGLGLVVSRDGTTARMLVILDEDPYGGRAVEQAKALDAHLDDALDAVGLEDARASLAGDTAVIAQLLEILGRDMALVAAIIVVVDLLLLALFLRSVATPLVVVGGTVLAVTASLGLTTLLFQGILDADGIAFYVPLATLVLLLSLGADYGVFSVGHIWTAARTRPLREAVLVSAGRTNATIATAGFVLALSFGLLALVPLEAFLQFAVAMSVGVLLDTYLVRPILLPAAILSLGRVSTWPARPVDRTART